ncbi:MAG TPA: hypothetical protein VNC60_10685 [Actinomycetota bacterium]|nr:hypothetical protein [Actinomycetota bacterium]
MSRTQQPARPASKRMRTRMHGASRAPLDLVRHDTETLESGVRYSWGRRGDAFYVWDNRTPGESRGHSSATGAQREFRWLEQEARVRRKRRLTRILVGVGLLCVAAAPALIMMLADGSQDSSSPAPDRGAAEVETPIGSSQRLTNDDGGYGFRVPEGWTTETSQSTSQVTDPAGDVTITVLVAPEGGIEAVSEASLASIAADWTGVAAEAPQDRTVGALPAVAVGGTATDASGAPVRFLSIVIDSGERNHAIWVSVPETGDASTFLPAVEQILGSFRPLERSA